jgi:hypothetical protein
MNLLQFGSRTFSSGGGAMTHLDFIFAKDIYPGIQSKNKTFDAVLSRMKELSSFDNKLTIDVKSRNQEAERVL